MGWVGSEGNSRVEMVLIGLLAFFLKKNRQTNRQMHLYLRAEPLQGALEAEAGGVRQQVLVLHLVAQARYTHRELYNIIIYIYI